MINWNVKTSSRRIRLGLASIALSLVSVSLVQPAVIALPINCASNASNSCPTNVALVLGATAKSLNVSWDIPIAGAPDQIEVKFFQPGTDPMNLSGIPVSASSTTYESEYSDGSSTEFIVGDIFLAQVLVAFSGSWYAASSQAVTVVGSPGAPQSVTSSRTGTGQILVSWSEPTDTGGNAITQYDVTCIPSCTPDELGSQVLYTDQTSLTITNLAPATSRTFTVSATNSNYTSASSTASNAVTPFAPPATPGALTVSAGDASVSVSNWGASSVTGATLTKYVVSTYLSSDVTFASPLAGKTVEVINLSSRSANITGLTNGTNYVVRVVAYAGDVTSSPRTSGILTPVAVPAVPAAPLLTRDGGVVTVSWSAPAANGSVIDRYDITYATTSGGTYTTPTTGTCSSSVVSTTCTVTGMAEGTTWHFKVRAHNSVGNGAYSASSAAITYPATQNLIQESPQTSTTPTKSTQSAPVTVPSAVKAKKKVSFPAKTSSGQALTVRATGGCKAVAVYKIVKIKVGKKKVKTKVLTGWTVQMTKKKSICTITQSAPAGDLVEALSQTSKVKVS